MFIEFLNDLLEILSGKQSKKICKDTSKLLFACGIDNVSVGEYIDM